MKPPASSPASSSGHFISSLSAQEEKANKRKAPCAEGEENPYHLKEIRLSPSLQTLPGETSLQTLPGEIRQKIMGYLPLKSLKQLQATRKTFNTEGEEVLSQKEKQIKETAQGLLDMSPVHAQAFLNNIEDPRVYFEVINSVIENIVRTAKQAIPISRNSNYIIVRSVEPQFLKLHELVSYNLNLKGRSFLENVSQDYIRDIPAANLYIHGRFIIDLTAYLNVLERFPSNEAAIIRFLSAFKSHNEGKSNHEDDFRCFLKSLICIKIDKSMYPKNFKCPALLDLLAKEARS